MRRVKELESWICLVAGVSCLALGAILLVGSRVLFDAEVFGAHAEKSLADPGVAAYAADLVTTSLVKSRPDLIGVRPLILASAAGIVSTRPFQVLVGTAARRAHQAVFSEGARRVLLSLPDVEVLVREALGQASPELAAKIPKQVQAAVTSLGESRNLQLLVDAWRLGRYLRTLWQVLFPAGLILLLLAIWFAPNRRRALVRGGIGLILAGLALAAIVPAGSLAAGLIENPLERGLARGLWRVYLAGLQDWGLFFAGLGLLFAAGAASLLETVDPIHRIPSFAQLLVAPPLAAGWRLAWAAALLFLGLLIVVYPQEILQAAVVIVGVYAAFVGVRELFRLFLEKLAPAQEADAAAGVRLGLGVVAVACVVALLAGAWIVWRNPAVKPVQAQAMSCNGHPELCDRRVDEVVFAGAHNAMSSQEMPGWMFPQHEAGIPHQLRDGIRALLIDVHHGFPGGARIKTDLQGEPLTEKVKEAVGREGLNAAMRIRNRLVGVDEGRRGLYLCHGLCELGASDFESTLRDIRVFLVAHPDEVLLVVVEDYVEPRELAAAFERSGLAAHVYRGPVAPRWPTLRELIAAGNQIVLFIESGRPGVPWIRPAFELMRETPYSFHSPGEFSCRANRGGDGGSLFQINHWIETAPMSKPSNAAIVNAYDFLLARAQQCAAERNHLPNILAVDFYRTGGLFQVVDRLNGVAK